MVTYCEDPPLLIRRETMKELLIAGSAVMVMVSVMILLFRGGYQNNRDSNDEHEGAFV